MMDHRIVPADWTHLFDVCICISEDDRAELEDGYGKDVVEVLEESYLLSDKCWAAVVEGETIAVFGVAVDRPWMVGTKNLDKHRFKFLKGCRSVIDEMMAGVERLSNVVDCRNKRTILWLKWLGFEFGEITFVGSKSLPFIEFHMEKK